MTRPNTSQEAAVNALPSTPRNPHWFNANPQTGERVGTWRRVGVALVVALMGSTALAQAVYRSVAPDGRVTFSDRPPPNAQATVTDKAAGTAPKADTEPNQLPFELQQLKQTFPVTLYSAQRCGPCDSGRKLLTARGIPFVEKTVNTREDIEAFERINPDNSLPLVTIGGQKVLGFSGQEWAQYLDNAGYPKASILPKNHVQAPAQPLVPLQPASAQDAANGSAPTNAQAAKPRPKPTVLPSSPTGIRF